MLVYSPYIGYSFNSIYEVPNEVSCYFTNYHHVLVKVYYEILETC